MNIHNLVLFTVTMFICPLCKESCYSAYDFKIHQHAIHPIPKENGTIEDIYSILKIQQEQQDKIITMLHKCKLFLNKKRKRINCCKYLNEQQSIQGRLELNYNEWCDNIDIVDDDFKNLFSYEYDICIMHIIKRHLSLHIQKNTSPIRCFDIKTKIFYIYGDDYNWHPMDSESSEYDKLFRLCDGRLQKYYSEWNKANNTGNVMSDISANIIKKFCNVKKNRKSVKKKLFNYLKTDVSSLVEMELC